MNLALRMRPDDLPRVTSTLFVGSTDRDRDLSAYWVLLLLSAVIAAAGVVADSTATVIGAMIVAPLMRPILGVALALVLADRRELVRALMFVLGGAALVILVGLLVGMVTQFPVVAETNGQVSGRVSPRLIDLLAALATGLVGAFALVRSDVSDTLPGVAIAISLVPPLAVVGLALESGEADQALGALLLFGTNVAAIVSTGVVLLLVSGLRAAAAEAGRDVGLLRGRTLAFVATSVLLVAVPLFLGSAQVAREQLVLRAADPVVSAWAQERGWTVTDIVLRSSTLRVSALGPRATPGVDSLRTALDGAGLDDVDLQVEFGLGDTIRVPAP